MRRFVVTGGCGFIGSHLSQAIIAAGDEVVVVDNLSSGCLEHKPDRAELIQADVTRPGVMTRALEGVHGCFHLAAVASVDAYRRNWADAHTTNSTGTVVVLNAAAGAKIPIVYASSAAVYGEGQRLPLKERAWCRPISHYGADKLAAELNASIASRLLGLRAIGLRLFNVFGPRQRADSPYSGVVARFRQALREGAPLMIQGDGSQTRDFIFVDDVVQGFLAAMTKVQAEPAGFHLVSNVCTGTATSILGLAETMMSHSGDVARHAFTEALPDDIRASVGDPTRMRKVLKIRRTIALNEGLERLFA